MRTVNIPVFYLLSALCLYSCTTHTYQPTTYQQNRVSAEELTRLLAEAGKGNMESQFELGNIYINGDGVPINYKDAFTWYEKAALQGHADAQFSLGLMYDKGHIGIPKNNENAYVWYKLASEQGLEDAQRNFTSLENLMTTSEIERANRSLTKLRDKIGKK
jgi:TPR repeat protein